MTIIVDNEEQKRAYLFKTNAQLDEWTLQINLIRTKVENKSLQVRNDYHHHMAAWREKKEGLRIKLDEILKTDASGFESLRFGAQQARSEVKAVYNKFSDTN